MLQEGYAEDVGLPGDTGAGGGGGGGLGFRV